VKAIVGFNKEVDPEALKFLQLMPMS